MSTADGKKKKKTCFGLYQVQVYYRIRTRSHFSWPRKETQKVRTKSLIAYRLAMRRGKRTGVCRVNDERSRDECVAR